MKVYSIGRGIECSIVIDDNTDVISRQHAVLNVSPWGKMTIVDNSHNGTYVNGIRINSNVPVPVTRKDNISFAHIARLDWNRIPKTYNPLLIAGIVLAALGVLVGLFFGIKALTSSGSPEMPKPQETMTFTPDQLKQREDSLMELKLKDIQDEQERQRVKDSIEAETAKKVRKQREDSIRDAKRDSLNRVRMQVKCKTCGKAISVCPHRGKHPVVTDSVGQRRLR
jgi:hypothetical protein